MSRHIGSGYGSEFHLMRYLARYRNELNSKIEKEIGGKVIEWLDFNHGGNYETKDSSKIVLPDQEWEGLVFLKSGSNSKDSKALLEWKTFWPQSGTSQNWDAIAKIDQNKMWILVEAKAHTGEIESDCGATSSVSIQKINKAFQETQQAFGITTANDWKKFYYQYANRLAVLHFLLGQRIAAKLLFIYFLGDKNPRLAVGNRCPETKEEWQNSLDKQNEYLGLIPVKKRDLGIHEIFVNVNP